MVLVLVRSLRSYHEEKSQMIYTAWLVSNLVLLGRCSMVRKQDAQMVIPINHI